MGGMADPPEREDPPPDEIPPEDRVAALPSSLVREPKHQRGLYGARLHKRDREILLEALRGGASIAAAAALIGRDRSTISRWRMLGAEGRPGYRKFYLDSEQALGHALRRLHNAANLAASTDGRLALALLDRLDPDFRALRAARRSGAASVVADFIAQPSDVSGQPGMAARVTYTLSWDDGTPLGLPGIPGTPFEMLKPGGNGNGNGSKPHPSRRDEDGLALIEDDSDSEL